MEVAPREPLLDQRHPPIHPTPPPRTELQPEPSVLPLPVQVGTGHLSFPARPRVPAKTPDSGTVPRRRFFFLVPTFIRP